VWGRVTANRVVKKTTWFYQDEFHLLLKDEQTAAYSVEIWKRFRKWGGIPTALTQNVKDLLASREIENIFEDLYCKGWKSNPLLLQQGGQPIRSSLRRYSRKGAIAKPKPTTVRVCAASRPTRAAKRTQREIPCGQSLKQG
jgi:hypothetical protein